MFWETQHPRWVLLVLALTGAAVGCVVPPPGSGPDDERPTPEELTGCAGMDDAFDEVVAFMEAELAAAEVPGAALVVVCDGQVAYGRSWGVLDHATDEPVTLSTRFQLASTTKMFTAAAALSLVDDGVVDLHAPVESYVPYANATTPFEIGATLHDLLSHSAGYPTTFPGGSFASYELDQFFANNSDQPLWSPPGAVFNYSNLGMSLAGLALEEAGGLPFADLVESAVFAPAGMEGASMHASQVHDEGEFAWGHSGSAAAPVVTAPTDSYYGTGYYGPMGGAWGGALDLARWGRTHLEDGGEVLSTASIEALRTPWIDTRKVPLQGYGYGLFIDRIYGFDLLSHGGSVGGFLTSWFLVPEERFGAFAVVNCDWYNPRSLTYEALDRFVGIPPVDGSLYTPSEDWSAYEGTYVDPVVLGTVEVRIDGGSLVADFVDLGFTSELAGSFDDTWSLYYEPQNRTVFMTFWRDPEGGAARYLVSLQGVATRVD